jgi:hypothetical protein
MERLLEIVTPHVLDRRRHRYSEVLDRGTVRGAIIPHTQSHRRSLFHPKWPHQSLITRWPAAIRCYHFSLNRAGERGREDRRAFDQACAEALISVHFRRYAQRFRRRTSMSRPSIVAIAVFALTGSVIYATAHDLSCPEDGACFPFGPPHHAKRLPKLYP